MAIGYWFNFHISYVSFLLIQLIKHLSQLLKTIQYTPENKNGNERKCDQKKIISKIDRKFKICLFCVIEKKRKFCQRKMFFYKIGNYKLQSKMKMKENKMKKKNWLKCKKIDLLYCD